MLPTGTGGVKRELRDKDDGESWTMRGPAGSEPQNGMCVHVHARAQGRA